MILITGGGTGGHLAIAKAVCEVYNAKGIRPIYIGSQNGQDRAWFEKYPGFAKTYFLNTGGVVNKKGLNKLFALSSILQESFTCRDIFRKHDIDKVFSVGGYSAAPASFAAIYSKVPLFIHEQNAKIGRLNKLLKPFAKEFFSSYEKPFYGYPVSTQFFETQRVRKEIKKVLFLGGSQGASFINTLVKNIAKDLAQRDIKIIHQCGSKDFEELKLFYEKSLLEVDLFPFSDTLHVKMNEADFAVSRAGASSLWELAANCLPTFFVPYPHAASDHQYYNAKNLVHKGVAFLEREESVDKEALLALIDSLDIEKISTSLEAYVIPDGANKIVDIIENGRKTI